ncbi:MAG: transcription elongation factor GreA [Patescibacteria group bacterium]|nr:transcription elongation factor GreA [Patescibacteria group bacterium]
MEYLTPEGFKKIQERLKYLKEEKREEIARRLAAAIELGDLTENAEYIAAKEEQGLTEAEIRRLENLLRTAVVVDDKKQKNKVLPGSQVLVQIEKEKEKYWLVGSEEADPGKGKISIDSPIGRALLDKTIGEVVVVKTPAGQKKIKILEIS